MTISYYIRDAMRFITWAALDLLGSIIYVGLAGIVAMMLDRKLPETKA